MMDRLLRGAGSRGLTGLRPVQELSFHPPFRALKIWRPLLGISKDQIQSLLRSRHIQWREDLSNRENKYRRNQIRNELLPFLSRWNPKIKEVLARLGEITAAEDFVLEGLLKPMDKKLKSRWGGGGYYCQAESFVRYPAALQRRWIRRVAEKLNGDARGLSFDRIEEIIRLWKGLEKGPKDMGFGIRAGKSQGRAFLRVNG